MGAKSGLLKNIPIDLLVILLSYVNFANAYSTLFLNRGLLSFKSTALSTKYSMTSSSPTGSLFYSLLLFVNPITLNPLWVYWIPDLDHVHMLRTFSGSLVLRQPSLCLQEYKLDPSFQCCLHMYPLVLYRTRFPLFVLPMGV